MGSAVFVLALLSALGSGLIAGFLFAFSVGVMPALGALPTAQGIDAFKVIDDKVVRPLFVTVFAGTLAVSVVAGILSLVAWESPRSIWVLAGAVIYLIGVIIETRIVHLPRNAAIKGVDSQSAEGAEMWSKFVPVWTSWNHVRTVAALAATLAFILALI